MNYNSNCPPIYLPLGNLFTACFISTKLANKSPTVWNNTQPTIVCDTDLYSCTLNLGLFHNIKVILYTTTYMFYYIQCRYIYGIYYSIKPYIRCINCVYSASKHNCWMFGVNFLTLPDYMVYDLFSTLFSQIHPTRFHNKITPRRCFMSFPP